MNRRAFIAGRDGLGGMTAGALLLVPRLRFAAHAAHLVRLCAAIWCRSLWALWLRRSPPFSGPVKAQ
jgi:hypothetical protein